jgi:hypothetical protein
MAKLETSRFICPSCTVEYRIIRIAADPTIIDQEITCRSCGGPLQGRDGAFVMKYLMVSPRSASATAREWIASRFGSALPGAAL